MIVHNVSTPIGYSLDLSFIDHDSFKSVKRSTLPLYKNMFVPDIQPPTLALIAVEDASVANCTVAEMQARYVARVLTVITHEDSIVMFSVSHSHGD